MAGCIIHVSITAESIPTKVENPTELIAGCLAKSIDPTVAISVTALKKIAPL